LERNKQVFNTSLPSSGANLFYSILHLFWFWTGTLPSLGTRLRAAGPFLPRASAPRGVGVLPPSAAAVLQPTGVPPPSHPIEDEDLLDYRGCFFIYFFGCSIILLLGWLLCF
jgi:hypothetical protein